MNVIKAFTTILSAPVEKKDLAMKQETKKASLGDFLSSFRQELEPQRRRVALN